MLAQRSSTGKLWTGQAEPTPGSNGRRRAPEDHLQAEAIVHAMQCPDQQILRAADPAATEPKQK